MAIINLANGSDTISVQFSIAGAAEVAIAALRNFHDNAEVCHRACWALAYIANGGNEICAKISSLGGCSIICTAAQSFPQHRGRRLVLLL